MHILQRAAHTTAIIVSKFKGSIYPCAKRNLLWLALFLVLLLVPFVAFRLLQKDILVDAFFGICYLARKYRFSIVAIIVAIIGILHTVYPLTKRLALLPNGLHRSVLLNKAINVRNSGLLIFSWIMLALSLVAILSSEYLLLSYFFMLTILIAFLLCCRYMFLASTSQLNKKVLRIEKGIRGLGKRQRDREKVQRLAMRKITDLVYLYFNFFENKNPDYSMAAILKRNHVYMKPDALIIFIYFGMLYYSCASLATRSAANNCQAFARVCAEIFSSNVRADLSLCGSMHELEKKWIKELCLHFNTNYLAVIGYADYVKEDLEHLAESHLLSAPLSKMAAHIHHYL